MDEYLSDITNHMIVCLIRAGSVVKTDVNTVDASATMSKSSVHFADEKSSDPNETVVTIKEEMNLNVDKKWVD